ncbi:MAG TPA: helix-hairpin-helix domain-containing protein, partial [Longimicrobium sp.]|nr:helix-hairpin-helix domain-containing protein [Longimicrobium sp.]
MSARTFAVAAVLGLALALVGTDAEAKGRKGAAKVSGVVNLNQATVAQLDLLPGVGAKAAQAIVTYREKQK